MPRLPDSEQQLRECMWGQATCWRWLVRRESRRGLPLPSALTPSVADGAAPPGALGLQSTKKALAPISFALIFVFRTMTLASVVLSSSARSAPENTA